MGLKGVLLAGGSGSRLFPLTLVTNKHLLPVYDRPMIYYPLASLKEMGCDEVLIVVGGRSVGDILELLNDGADMGLSLTYRYQRGALGIAHAIGLARGFAGDDPIAIVLGDNIVHGSLRGFADTFRESDAHAGVVLTAVPDAERFGVAALDPDGRIIGFEEKPERPKSDLISIGVYLFRPSVFAVIDRLEPSARGELEITDLLNHYLADGSLVAHRPRRRVAGRRHHPVAARGEQVRSHLCQGDPGRDRTRGRRSRGRAGAAQRHSLMSDRLPERLLVTGGAGFIGSAFARRILERHDDVRVTVLDKLTYAGNRANLGPLEGDPRFTFVHGDIADVELVDRLAAETDAIVNFAAESHVDRSIEEPGTFIRTDVVGTFVLLEAARRHGHHRFLQISTDEVYGDVERGSSTEHDALRPRSPYSASKSGGDLLVGAYHATYGLATLLTRASNNFGPFQYPEKIVPLFITNAIDDEPLPLYGDGLQVRDWLYVDDHCDALEIILARGEPGAIYNVGGGNELTNLELTRAILELLDKPMDLIRSVADRAGHDRRYAVDSSRVHALGWRPAHDFADALAETVRWYREHEAWWRPLKSGEYRDYYRRQYGTRLAGSAAVD